MYSYHSYTHIHTSLLASIHAWMHTYISFNLYCTYLLISLYYTYIHIHVATGLHYSFWKVYDDGFLHTVCVRMSIKTRYIPSMDLQCNLHIPTKRCTNQDEAITSSALRFRSSRRFFAIAKATRWSFRAPTSVGHQTNHLIPQKCPTKPQETNPNSSKLFLVVPGSPTPFPKKWGGIRNHPGQVPSRPFQLAWNLHELCHINPQHGPLPTPAC